MSDPLVLRLLSVIKKSFPEIVFSRYQFVEHTYGSYVILIGNEQKFEKTFKFPREQRTILKTIPEILLLRYLCPIVGVAIPYPEHICDTGSSFPGLFWGYPFIDGYQLTNERFIQSVKKVPIAKQIGEFLSAIHTTELHKIDTIGLQKIDYYEYILSSWIRFHEATSPAVLNGKYQWVRKFVTSYLARGEYFDFDYVLVHGDLGHEHICVDYRNESITGFLDFTEAHIGDAAYDFAVLCLTYGFHVYSNIRNFYYDKSNEGLFNRRVAAYACLHCINAIAEGLDSNDINQALYGEKLLPRAKTLVELAFK